MSIKLSLWCCCMLAMTQFGFAQSKFAEGVINYLITIEGSKDPNMALLNNSSLTALFKGNMNKVKLDIMGGLVSINTILDEQKKEGLMLMDMMAKQMAVKISKSDFEEGSAASIPKISPSSETKTIAGYLCKKSTFKAENGEQVTIYTSDKIQPKNNSFLQKIVGNLKGFPLGMETKLPDGGTIKLIAQSIEKNSPEKHHFNMKIPTGYEVTTLEELQNKAGGKGLFGK